MRKEINWTKGAFSYTYNLMERGEAFGALNMKTWSYNASGKIYDKHYSFESNGYFSKKYNILDITDKKHIGVIKMGGWGNKAHMSINGKNYQWGLKNCWGTKWHLSHEHQIEMMGNSNGFLTKGSIQYKETEPILMLASIFIKGYFSRINGMY